MSLLATLTISEDGTMAEPSNLITCTVALKGTLADRLPRGVIRSFSMSIPVLDSAGESAVEHECATVLDRTERAARSDVHKLCSRMKCEAISCMHDHFLPHTRPFQGRTEVCFLTGDTQVPYHGPLSKVLCNSLEEFYAQFRPGQWLDAEMWDEQDPNSLTKRACARIDEFLREPASPSQKGVLAIQIHLGGPGGDELAQAQPLHFQVSVGDSVEHLRQKLMNTIVWDTFRLSRNAEFTLFEPDPRRGSKHCKTDIEHEGGNFNFAYIVGACLFTTKTLHLCARPVDARDYDTLARSITVRHALAGSSSASIDATLSEKKPDEQSSVLAAEVKESFDALMDGTKASTEKTKKLEGSILASTDNIGRLEKIQTESMSQQADIMQEIAACTERSQSLHQKTMETMAVRAEQSESLHQSTVEKIAACTEQLTKKLQELHIASAASPLPVSSCEPPPTSQPEAQRPDQSHAKSDRHHPANCGVCEERIIGLRLKCATCPDYELAPQVRNVPRL